MKIRELISEDGILTGIKAENREEVTECLVGLHSAIGNVRDTEQFSSDIMKRENMGSTAVGGGVAIPHAKSSAVRRAGLCAVTLPEGVDWGSPDGMKTNLVFMIAAPETGNDEHLSVLSRLVTLLMNEKLTEKLANAENPSEFLSVLEEYDTERYDKTPSAKNQDKSYRLVAVTACPTGIAHTYMAAESLKKAAEGLGIGIKVETDGSSGADNALSDEDIKKAEAVIVAADRAVEMSRFDGKPLISVSTGDAIHRGEDVILSAVSGNVRSYRHKGAKTTGGGGAVGWRAMYGYLMNGVSHMLPFVVAGGLFIAISFLIDTFSGVSETALLGSASPASSFFNKIGSTVFSFMLPVLAGYISSAVADRPGFLPGFVGGWLAAEGATFQNPAGDVSSGFLGALFAGFAAGFVMLLIEAVCDTLPKALEGLKPVLIYPLLGLLIISLIMCGVNPLMGIINNWISGLLEALNGVSAVILGAVLGAMMSFDMGGPVNKAAYVFGTASIASGNLSVMAAVMAGGMVPPLAIALATGIFPKKFSPDERKNGPVNYVLGLSFITEGAIPYAASDPIRVIPSCMVGASIAGALSMLFGCTLGAPHGGVFVLPFVGNGYLYILSVVLGAVISALILGAVKKNYVRKENNNGKKRA